MPSTENVQDAHISARLRALHAALLDIVSVMNRPQRDELLLGQAGVRLEQPLFQLLVGIGRFGPIGIVDLAERIGRDYTTVSRQVSRLEKLGLAGRAAGGDRRVRAATLTAAGERMIGRIDAARERLARVAFAGWTAQDLDDLARLMRRFADTIAADPPATPDSDG